MQALSEALEKADQVASVVGAAAGLLALVITVRDRPRPGRVDSAVLPESRRWLRATFVFALLALLSGAARSLPGPASLLPGWLTTGAAAVGAVLAAGSLVRYRLRRRAGVTPTMLRVFGQLQSYAVQHRHNFGDGHVPALDRIYVEQRTSTSARGTDRRRNPVRLTVPAMLGTTTDALVVGGPGAGKSTMILRVAHEGARAWAAGTPDNRSPYRHAVPMPAVTTVLAEDGTAAALAGFCATELGVPVAREVFERPPGPGCRWLVLVDGLDELPDQRQRSRLLHRLAAEVGRGDSPYRFLVASRPLDRRELDELRGDRVGHYDLQTFEPDDLADFARKWFAVRAPDDDAAAAAYLRSIDDAALAPIVRIPLLATIAALVHERDEGAALPASRSGLYDRFVENLLRTRAGNAPDARSIRPATGGQEEPARRLLSWLDANLLRLLEQVAFDRLWNGDRRDLVARAVDLSGKLSGVAPTGIAGWWEGRVREALLGSGLIVRSGSGVAFLHQSIGEYLASARLAATTEEPPWATWLSRSSTRGIALFALARGGEQPAALVRTLAGQDQARLGAYIVMDRSDLDRETYGIVAAGLLARIDDDADDAVECLTLVEALSWHEDVRTAVLAFIADSSRPVAARASVCDALSRAMPDQVRPVVRAIARDSGAPDAVQQWMADSLAALGDESERLLARVRFGPAEEADRPGALRHHALTVAATDARRPEQDRVAAATSLSRMGDPTGRAALLAVAESGNDPAARSMAVSELLHAGHDVAPTVLFELFHDARTGFALRAKLLGRLGRIGGPDVWTGLAAIARSAAFTEHERQVALNTLMNAHDAAAETTLAGLLDSDDIAASARIEVAEVLARRGDRAGLRVLCRMAARPESGPLDRWRAFDAVATSPDREAAAPMIRAVTRGADEADRQQMATRLLSSHDDIAADLLVPIATSVAAGSATRLSAITGIIRLGEAEPARMARVLRTVVRQKRSPYQVRLQALQALVERMPDHADLRRLVPAFLRTVPNATGLEPLLSAAADADPRLREWVRRRCGDPRASFAHRSVLAESLAGSATGRDLRAAGAVARDRAFPDRLRVSAAQTVHRWDRERGIELFEAQLRSSGMHQEFRAVVLTHLMADEHPAARRALGRLAADREVDPRLRLRVVRECPDLPGVSRNLADLVVEERLALPDRTAAARLLADRDDDTAAVYGLRLGTEPLLEIACRAYALIAAARSRDLGPPWFASVRAVAAHPRCPAHARVFLIKQLGRRDEREGAETLISLAADQSLWPADRAEAGLAMLRRHPAAAVLMLQDALDTGRLPARVAGIAADAIREHASHGAGSDAGSPEETG